MKINKLKENWNRFGAKDPLWAILTEESKINNQWNEKDFFERGEKEIFGLMTVIKNQNIPLNKGKALDFGCGVGRLTQSLASRFESTVGVDIAETMIEKAKELNKHGEKCQYITNTVDNLEIFEDESFDLVYTLITLQHMKPIYSMKYIEEFIRILKPDGLLVFQLPDKPPPVLNFLINNAAPVLNFYRRIKYHKSMVMEVYGVAKEDVEKVLDKNGAYVVHTKSFANLRDSWKDQLYFVKKKA